MQVHASILCALLLLPLAAGVPLAEPRASLASVPALPADLPDAELMLMLAGLDHPDVRFVQRALPAQGDTLGAALARVGATAGVTLAPEEAAAFDALDPALKAPLLTLFVTFEQTNAMIATARVELSEEEAHRMIALRNADATDTPEYRALAAQIDVTMLLNAGILLTDTVELLVVPALQKAIAAGAWPAAGRWDSVGILRLGSTGDDVERLDRIVQIDPTGNDLYRNNAGGSTLFDPLYGPFNIVTPTAVSVDFAGDDDYFAFDRIAGSQGGGEAGFGLLYDFEGDDEYECGGYCQGGGSGIARDFAGHDRYWGGSISTGAGDPYGVLRDDEGNDEYKLWGNAGGFSASSGGIGLLWNRGGADDYLTNGFADRRLGWALRDARGLFADEGDERDYYQTAEWPVEPSRHGCNDCTWIRGSQNMLPRAGGRGNDNAGGLATLLADIGP